MAERALTDSVFYQEALADPKRHLVRYYAFMSRSRIRDGVETMTSEKKAEFERRAVAFLTAAQAAHLKWNGSTWTRARHLLGLLCIEERRCHFARALLNVMGKGDALHPPSDTLAGADSVDLAARARLAECKADGSLKSEIASWGLDAPETIRELTLLATAPPGATETDPALTAERTPRLFECFIPMLFVGFAHNLYVESAVSKLANLEKIHPNLDALTLQEMFLYKAKQETSRAARLDACMRSQTGGGLRGKARERANKPLGGLQVLTPVGVRYDVSDR